MFNTTIIDVAIGIIFVYLLLSLISSAAHEMIEYWLKKRSSDLERGVRELLTTEDGSDPGKLVQSLYNHGMVSGLFKGESRQIRQAELLFEFFNLLRAVSSGLLEVTRGQ